jgi:alanine-synthesizing transaminase
MQFRRVDDLPPYAFAEINARKLSARRAGVDVIDLGFGNPDIPSPPGVVDKLIEAASQGKNHRYSASRGIPNLRKAVADRYERAYGVSLDPETEVINTIGAKEGLSHLMWTLVQPGDVALVPEPSYPIHIYAPVLAGAEVRRVHLSTDSDFFDRLTSAFRTSWPKPRVIVTSFPHNPTTVTVDTEFFEKLVDFAHRNDVALVHDFAYADIAFDGYRPPSILSIDGAKDVAVELYTLSKSHSMAGWRVGFVVGNAEMVAALQQLKSYLDYGTFQPIQIAGIIALNDHDEYIGEVVVEYKLRSDTLIDGLRTVGWEIDVPKATMFVWAKIPESHRHMGSLDFALDLLDKAEVAVSPGIGFGPSGDDYVRFALVENTQRINQAVRNIRRYFEERIT